jgi:predicted TIM-barrel fold metal-dependent hydrolase
MSTVTGATRQSAGAGRTKLGIIDCDVHNTAPSVAYLKRYLPERWHPYVPQLFGRTWAGVTIGARQAPDIYRRDSHPPSGGAPGSDVDFLREQLLDRWGIEKAVLNPLEVLAWQLTQYGELAHALSAASNTWLVEDWLEHDHRLYASMSIPQEDGIRAAQEIERLAPDKRFVAVLMTIWGREPYGHPKYLPIFEAASACDLPVVMHVGGWSGQLVAGGTPTYWSEHHSLNYGAYAAHVASLIYSGVFDRLPNLRIVLEEGGIGWMPSLLWRLDRSWRELREHLPHITRLPSEIAREHFWFTTQPLDEPNEARYLVQMFEHLGMDDHIMFATDYPHHDFDAPDRVLPSQVPLALREKIFRHNAEAFFKFEQRS